MLCLNMIVRNEAANIERCLASVAPVIGAWVIGDTGSTDATPELIRNFFAARGIPGELHRFPFVDFGQARNEALARCRASPLAFDYLLLVDADMELVVEAGDCFAALSAAGYLLRQRWGAFAYDNLRLLRRDATARYVGVTHEYLQVDGAREHLSGAWFVDHASGGNRPGKFARDARLLEAELERDPGNARNVYYLAQSYRDDGRIADAIAAYLRRAAMGGRDEEAWSARYEAARLIERQGRPAAEVEYGYHAAYQQRPQRAEPLYELARWHRNRGEWALAQLHAQAALGMTQPPDRLFLDESIYRWRIQDEAAIAAQWLGGAETCFALCWGLLDDDRLPAEERPRVESNRDFAAAAVGERTRRHPAEILERLAAARRQPASGAGVTLTVACTGREAFERSVDTFVNCCRDIDRVERFVACVEGMEPTVLADLEQRYRCFEFIASPPGSAGQARSLGLLLEAIATPYWLHLPEAWHFLVTTDYVGRALAILQSREEVAQVMFNRNFARTLGDRVVAGGECVHDPRLGLRYVLHHYVPEGSARHEFLRRLRPGTVTSVDRLPFALAPSLLRVGAMRRAGPLVPSTEGQGDCPDSMRHGALFAPPVQVHHRPDPMRQAKPFATLEPGLEQGLGQRFVALGLRSAFFDAVTCIDCGMPGASLADLDRTSIRPPNVL